MWVKGLRLSLSLCLSDLPCHPVELSEEEKQQILQSTDFSAFMERSSRMIEHAMAEPSGLFFELMMGDGEMSRWVGASQTALQASALTDYPITSTASTT